MVNDTAQNQFAGQDLNKLYQETIDKQRAYLLDLQQQFNKKCEEAKIVAQEKLKNIPKEDKDAKTAVLEEQKAALEVILKNLRTAVDESTRKTMKLLETINIEREKKLLADLDRQIAAL